MKRSALIFPFVLGWVCFPQSAWANVGTPLMWAGLLHLAIGNALIGLLEGLLLGRFFGIRKTKAIGAMIVANYISAWLGGFFLRGAIMNVLPLDLNNAWRWFWVMVVATYCLTLILEWPFVLWGFHGTPDWVRRSVRASLVIQSVSYALLFGWYWMASATSLYTRMHIVEPGDLALPESVLVYYIDSADGNIYRRPLSGGASRKIHKLHSKDVNDRLFARPAKADTNRWDLLARLETGDDRKPNLVEVLTNLLVEAAPDAYFIADDPDSYRGTSHNFGRVQTLGSPTDSMWDFWTGFWPMEGLRGFNETTREHIRFSYETPFGAWRVRNAVHLPSDKVLFQLEDNQICAFDPAQRRVALLWRGRGPVPVLETPAPNRAVLECRASMSGAPIMSMFSLALAMPVNQSSKQADLCLYFDSDDCAGGAIVGHHDEKGYLFPIGKRDWRELHQAAIPAVDASSAAAITPVTQAQEGLAFWLKTADGRWAMVRIAAVQPSTYEELLHGKTARVAFEWMWR